MNAHPEPFVFHAQVGDGDLDHSYWGPPEFMSMKRPVYSLTITTSGTEPLAEAAAALAAGSIIFREADPEYSDKALGHALELFEFADKYRKEMDSRTVVLKIRPMRIVDVNPKKGISLFNTPSIKIL